MIKLLCILAVPLSLSISLAAETCEENPAAAIDCAFNRIYNFDFRGANGILDKLENKDPEFPVTYSVRAAALLFSELHRMRILETEFFRSDDKVITVKLKADPR